MLAQAPKDLLRLRLGASPTLGQIQIKGKNETQSRARLLEVSRAATEKGFEWIARQASAR
jgi:hypothetical protein